MNHTVLFITQVFAVLLASQAIGGLFRRIRQPLVIGQMVAGILLGPSVLGWLAPEISSALFPHNSLGALQTLSSIGILFFMFIVGLDFNPKVLKGRGHSAVIISHAGIIAPFLLGMALAVYLHPRLSGDNVDFLHFALFLGTAMSITAFPVLAGILMETRLIFLPVGAMAIACAAVDDITAWSILAIVIILVRSNDIGMPFLLMMITGTIAFTVFMIYGFRHLLSRFENSFHKHGKITMSLLGIILLMLCASSLITEKLGIHSLFGAFLLGAIFPKNNEMIKAIKEKLEGITQTLFLPIFFATTGLRTSIGLVSGMEMWFYCGLILLVAIAGKFGGATLAARMTGHDWPESRAIGVLMNTRGLVELVVLNIGLEIGVLSPPMFAMMVIMALLTTFMATPLLHLIYPPSLQSHKQEQFIYLEKAA